MIFLNYFEHKNIKKRVTDEMFYILLYFLT